MSCLEGHYQFVHTLLAAVDVLGQSGQQRFIELRLDLGKRVRRGRRVRDPNCCVGSGIYTGRLQCGVRGGGRVWVRLRVRVRVRAKVWVRRSRVRRVRRRRRRRRVRFQA